MNASALRLETRRPTGVILTERLRLRPWRKNDLAPFAELNADPRVMEYFPSPLTRAESDLVAERIRDHFAQHGFGLWAAEHAGQFIGFIGLSIPSFEAPFMPCVEIGWRIAASHWGRGLATEGARAVLRYGFDTLRLSEMVSFTSVANARSRRVMEKLGMQQSGYFEHPRLPEGHALRWHVLYRIGAGR